MEGERRGRRREKTRMQMENWGEGKRLREVILFCITLYIYRIRTLYQILDGI